MEGDLASEATAWVREALSRPGSYPHNPPTVEVRETHISWVFLAGERAYKLKKPIVLEFLDYGSAARRREMCDEEGAAQPAADARHLSLGARQATAALAPVLVVESRFERNLHELLRCVEQRGEIGRVQALERFAHAFIASHAQTFQTRASRGLIREGQGDLRAEHVLVDGRVRIVDCVEFARELRELDVADDLAFLVFDLAAHGGERLARALVQAYRDAGGDPGDDSLISFYATYRALVRAKVALVRAALLPPRSAEQGEESAHARDLILLAERFAWQARLPLVIVVCGVPASGKSHLAAALAELSGLPHLSSDLTRKQLTGVRPTQRAAAERYSAEWNARTYAELARRAAQGVAENRGAIVDATFRHRADREAFASAFGAAAPLRLELRDGLRWMPPPLPAPPVRGARVADGGFLRGSPTEAADATKESIIRRHSPSNSRPLSSGTRHHVLMIAFS